jgi:hypothetical protein
LRFQIENGKGKWETTERSPFLGEWEICERKNSDARTVYNFYTINVDGKPEM